LQFGFKLPDQVRLEDFGSLASVVKVHLRNIPSADLKLTRFYHRDKFFDRFENVSKTSSSSIKLKSYVGSSTLGE
jgi:hypothetical protein